VPSTAADGGTVSMALPRGSDLASFRLISTSLAASSGREACADVDPPLGLLPAVSASSSDGINNSQAPNAASSTRLPAATEATNAPRHAQMEGRLRFPDIPDNLGLSEAAGPDPLSPGESTVGATVAGTTMSPCPNQPDAVS
jgi:hypothetical protein